MLEWHHKEFSVLILQNLTLNTNLHKHLPPDLTKILKKVFTYNGYVWYTKHNPQSSPFNQKEKNKNTLFPIFLVMPCLGLTTVPYYT